MTKLKTILFTGAMVLGIGATSITAFAATSSKTPAEIVAGLTGRTVESVVDEKQDTGKTYGTIAAEAGKLNDFKEKNLDARKAYLNNEVKEGRLTKERADEMIKNLEKNQVTCDGTGKARIGQRSGQGCGYGNIGGCKGAGGRGQGQRLRDSSCCTTSK